MKINLRTYFFCLLFISSLLVGNSAMAQIQSKNSSENYLFSNDRVWVSHVYPNPAVDFVDIDFQIASSVREVKLTFYNVLGQEVRDVVLEKDQKNTHIDVIYNQNDPHFTEPFDKLSVQEKKSLSEVAQNYGYKLGVLNSTGVKTMSNFKNYGGGFFGNKTDSSKGLTPTKEVNIGSDLFGKRVVFTGELSTLTREMAIQRAVDNGAIVNSAVSGKTNFLVVGISDLIDFNEGRKTRKLKAAEVFSDEGHDISIIDEEDFLKMSI